MSRDGTQLFFFGAGEMSLNIWAFSIEDATVRPVSDLGSRPGTLDTEISTDGDYLYFAGFEDQRDLWVMDVFEQ